MTRYLCDTSALIAAVSSWHEHHERTRSEIERRERSDEQMVVAGHSLAETYSVLTRLPAPHRLRADDAIALIESNWRDTPIVHLTGSEMWSALREAQRRELIGGQMSDALIAIAALKAKATTLITWNVRNFVPFAPSIAVVAPR
ncbi:MAG: PIN domain-containing protein [Spirochaetaceae bacterium]|nr:PIN domain-containing protein [Spirochaetaceae bacterium]